MAYDKNQLDRIEDMLTQLISIVGATNSGLSDVRKDILDLKSGQEEIKQTVQHIEAQQALEEKRLDVQRTDIAEVRERVGIIERGNQ